MTGTGLARLQAASPTPRSSPRSVCCPEGAWDSLAGRLGPWSAPESVGPATTPLLILSPPGSAVLSSGPAPQRPQQRGPAPRPRAPPLHPRGLRTPSPRCPAPASLSLVRLLLWARAHPGWAPRAQGRTSLGDPTVPTPPHLLGEAAAPVPAPPRPPLPLPQRDVWVLCLVGDRLCLKPRAGGGGRWGQALGLQEGGDGDRRRGCGRGRWGEALGLQERGGAHSSSQRVPSIAPAVVTAPHAGNATVTLTGAQSSGDNCQAGWTSPDRRGQRCQQDGSRGLGRV